MQLMLFWMTTLEAAGSTSGTDWRGWSRPRAGLSVRNRPRS